MPRAAVAVAHSSDSAARAQGPADSDLQRRLSSLGKQIGHGRRFRPRRSYLALVGMLILGVWLVLVFGRALTELNEATDRQAAIAAESQALEQRLEAGRRELELVQTDAFQRLQARAFGIGDRGERVFMLAPDAPSPPPIVPLGGTAPATTSETPLEAWLGLLFGD